MIFNFTDKHLDEIANIEKKTFESPWLLEDFKSYLKKNLLSMSYIYKKGNKIAGYLMCQNIIDEVHIHNIAVDENYQNQSIGKEMIKYLIKESKRKKINKLCLEVDSSNIFALKLYARFGFYKVGKRKDYYENGNDAILMDLIIKNGRMV